MQNNRTTKAIEYLNKHKAKKIIIESKVSILRDLNRMDLPVTATISGNTATFMLAICNRFRSGFFVQEYIAILDNLTAEYTEKQIKHFDWV